MIAGVAMNFIVAVGITTYLLTQGVMEPSGRVHVEKVVAGSPAEKAGISVGDTILSILSPSSKLPRKFRSPKELIEETKYIRESRCSS